MQGKNSIASYQSMGKNLVQKYVPKAFFYFMIMFLISLYFSRFLIDVDSELIVLLQMGGRQS